MIARAKKLKAVFCGATTVALACSMQISMAAQQCLAAPGTYGAVTVTGCDNNPTLGVINPISTYLASIGAPYTSVPYDGLALGQLTNATSTCTYTFSHSILTKSITVNTDAIQVGDVFSVELDGQPYSFTASDIVKSPLPASSDPTGLPVTQGPLIISNGTITSNLLSGSSGAVSITNSSAQRVSSLKLSMAMTASLGGSTQVCIDDAKESQAITFTSTPPTQATVAGPTYNVSATGGGSNNPVTFAVDASSSNVCSISGSTLRFTGAGTCLINANQAGNDSFDPAPAQQQSFTVSAAVTPPTQAATPVPAIGQWVLTLLSLVLTGFAAVSLRRTRMR
ncbi:hypothetical protein ACFIQG_20285 [Comamonas odontotermitis]|uniref:hypothetical protein n=1 Tax=Comamonas odontotermitis TaxID=379895 RepID=UPI00366B8412